ncbi:IS66 family transposase, partial [Schleiferilactobacillus harbinensis]
RAERAVKELVIGRKNWLFSQSKRGATAAGVILSLLTTARANHLDPSKYFNYLFDTVPNLPAPGDMVALQDYLPWAPKVQAFCHE